MPLSANNVEIAGDFTSNGQTSTEFTLSCNDDGSPRKVRVNIDGTFTASVTLQVYNDRTAGYQNAQAAWTSVSSNTFEVVARGEKFRLKCTAYTSGTVSYDIKAPNN